MPRLKTGSPPSYRLHKASGQAIVTIDGRDYYLGTHGTPASRKKYAGLIRAWEQRRAEAAPAPTPLTPDDRATVNDLILGFLTHVRDYYKPGPNGVAGETVCIADALDVVQRLFGREPADQFGPLKLKAVRQAMVEKNWSRGYVNHQVSRVKRMFAWATEEELVPGSVFHALLAVKGLKKGKGQVREGRKVRPAPKGAVKAALGKAHPVLAAMIRFQWLTGCRPGELCAMRPRDVDRSKKVWVYTVPDDANKTDHLDHARRIYIGPRAQRVLEPWLDGAADEFVFSPKRAEAVRAAARRAARKTPLYRSHLARLERKRRESPPRPRRDRYDTKTYRTAVRRACKSAGVVQWHPHQLRHSAATRFRRKYGIEVARILLGHRKLSTTEVYAEQDVRTAMKAAKATC